MANGTRKVTGWVGWVYFAGILLILRGISEAALGITALVNRHYLFVNNDRLVDATNNMTAWGGVDLGVGIVLFLIGLAVLRGSAVGRAAAIFLVGLSFLVNMAFLAVFPIWAIVAMAVDVFIIYSLAVRGDEV
ncbi:MAG TPA: hypothetical protein VHC21_03300 [Candidatus Saccharimonadales bacterium]|nr:hypothetical protein [Candidatus Saccharimonadales bacterium]